MKKVTIIASRLSLFTFASIFALYFVSCSSDDDENSANKNTLIGEWVSVPGGKGNACDLTYQFNSDGTGFYKSSGGVWADFNYTTSGGYDAPTGSIYFRFVFVNSECHSVWRSESSGSYRVFGDSLRLTPMVSIPDCTQGNNISNRIFLRILKQIIVI